MLRRNPKAVMVLLLVQLYSGGRVVSGWRELRYTSALYRLRASK